MRRDGRTEPLAYIRSSRRKSPTPSSDSIQLDRNSSIEFPSFTCSFHSETRQRHPRELFFWHHSPFTPSLYGGPTLNSSQAAALEYMGPGVQLVALRLRLCELDVAAGATRQASLAIPARPSPFRRHPLRWPSAF